MPDEKYCSRLTWIGDLLVKALWWLADRIAALTYKQTTTKRAYGTDVTFVERTGTFQVISDTPQEMSYSEFKARRWAIWLRLDAFPYLWCRYCGDALLTWQEVRARKCVNCQFTKTTC